MRSLLISGILAAVIPLAGFTQTFTIAPPSDPLEPVTGMVQDVTTAEQRAAAVALLNRASDQYAMHTKGTPAHVLQISFNATASTLFGGGAGHLTETWISGQNWRWDATFGNYSLLRISSNGVAYDQQALQPVPVRIKMLANAVFAPLQFTTPRVSAMRTASVPWKGAQITCILLGAGAENAMEAATSGATSGPTSASGRRWNESEFCVDPATGLLDIYSEVPGIYAFYDYSNALKFHDRILPGAVAIHENGAEVVQSQLTSIADTDGTNTSPFTPTAQMKSQGAAVVLFAPTKTIRRVWSPNVATGATVEPVIVHVTLDEQGKVQESEVLQTSAASAQALAQVTQTKLWPIAMQQNDGTPPRQQGSCSSESGIPARSPGELNRRGSARPFYVARQAFTKSRHFPTSVTASEPAGMVYSNLDISRESVVLLPHQQQGATDGRVAFAPRRQLVRNGAWHGWRHAVFDVDVRDAVVMPLDEGNRIGAGLVVVADIEIRPDVIAERHDLLKRLFVAELLRVRDVVVAVAAPHDLIFCGDGRHAFRNGNGGTG